MEFSKKERQRQRLEKLRKESFEAQKEFEAEQSMPITQEPSKKKYFVIGAIVLLLVAGVSYFAIASSGPGPYDDFAKCLSEKGAIVYGNDFCSFTQKQLGWFGKSKNYLSYVKCAENKGLCNSKGVKVTPTWEIAGTMYPEVQTFERLSSITGCEIFKKQ